MAITAESLTELIAETQKAYDDVQAELQNLGQRAAELTKQRDSIAAERDAFVSSLERRFPGTPVPPEAERTADPIVPKFETTDDDWSLETRSESVIRALQVLTARDGFASPGSIEELLKEKNRDDSRDNIGAALAYLNRTQKAHSLGRAKWAPGVG